MTVPEERPAPGGLELIRRFVNTRDIEQGTDELTTPEALRAWLVSQGPGDPAMVVRGTDLACALALREAFRAFLVANAAGEPPPADAVDILNRAALQFGLAPRVAPSGGSTIVSSARGADAALGALISRMHEEIASGRWIRLKACLEDSCHWAFYDTSRNHSSRWCQMGVCGNRNKNRAYYARRRAQETSRTD